MRRLGYLFAFCIACASCALRINLASAQGPLPTVLEPVAQSVVDRGLSVKVVTEKALWTAEGFEEIKANGKSYLAFTSPPKPVASVLLQLTNNGQPYIEISKVDSTEFPVVVDEYKPGQFIFEHQGPGVYHIRSTDTNGRPAYAKFIVGTPGPVDPPPVVDPPPSTDHAPLVAIIAKRPVDAVTAKALAAGYRAAVTAITPATVTLDEARKIVAEERAKALRSVPQLTVDWNAVLLDVSGYMMKLTTKADYIAALGVLANEIEKPKAAAVQSTPVAPFAADSFTPRQPVFFYQYNTNCPGGVCPPQLIRRR